VSKDAYDFGGDHTKVSSPLGIAKRNHLISMLFAELETREENELRKKVHAAGGVVRSLRARRTKDVNVVALADKIIEFFSD
jgi:hypothetical protein